LKSITTEEEPVLEMNGFDNTRPRRGMSNFWGKFKNSLIDIFKEERRPSFVVGSQSQSSKIPDF
jgi:hypothetical protein